MLVCDHGCLAASACLVAEIYFVSARAESTNLVCCFVFTRTTVGLCIEQDGGRARNWSRKSAISDHFSQLKWGELQIQMALVVGVSD